MTGSERQRLRALIDARRRELEHDDAPRCAGCGCHHDDRTRGCRTCTNRWLRRGWRASDDYRIRERVYDAARKRRRKARTVTA